MPSTSADGDEPAARRGRLTVLVAAPAAHSPGFENPAAMEFSSAHLDETIGGRRIRLAGLVTPPALDNAVRTQSAGMGETRADFCERPRWRRGLAVLPETPAHHIAVGSDGAVVVEAGADRCELAGELVGALAVLVPAPASNRVVHGNSAAVPETGRYGQEPVRWRTGLAIMVPTPTRRCSALTQGACVRAAGADRGELARVDANPAVAVRAPTGRRAIRRQTATVRSADAQADQDIRLLRLRWVRLFGRVLGGWWLLLLHWRLPLRLDLLLRLSRSRRRRSFRAWRRRGLVLRRNHAGHAQYEGDDRCDRSHHHDEHCCATQQASEHARSL